MDGREERLNASKTLRNYLEKSPMRLRLNTLNACLDKVEDEGEQYSKRRSGKPRSRRSVLGVLSEEDLPDFIEPETEELEYATKTGIERVLNTVRWRTDPFYVVQAWDVDKYEDEFYSTADGNKEIGGYVLDGTYCRNEWEGTAGDVSACIAGFEWARPRVNQCLLDVGGKPLKGDGTESLFSLL